MRDTCTGGNGGVYSCAIRHDISSGAINNPYAIHSLAAGIGTTDLTATRDWLTEHMVGVSEFGKDLATNFTNLVRSNFAIDDRITKAWFVNPGYNWATVNTASQSSLQLSDRLLALALITLNNGEGQPVRRRLLTLQGKEVPVGTGKQIVFETLSSRDVGPAHDQAPSRREPRKFGTSPHLPAGAVPPKRQGRRNARRSATLTPAPKTDEAKIKEAFNAIAKHPREGALPPVSYDVNVGRQIANILNIKHDRWGMVDVSVAGKFHNAVTTSEINDMISARLKRNMGRFCATCNSLFPVFYNIEKVHQNHLSQQQHATATGDAGKRRMLLQTLETDSELVAHKGTVSVMFSYQKEHNDLVFSEMFRSIIDKGYSDVWTGDLSKSNNIDDYVKNMKNEQFVLTEVKPTWDEYNTTNVIMDMEGSAKAGASWVQDVGATSGGSNPTPETPLSGTTLTVDQELGILENRSSTSAAPAPPTPALLSLALVSLLIAACAHMLAGV